MSLVKCVLFDVDGTLIDAARNQREVWGTWARRYGLDGDDVYQVALRTRPVETFAQVAPDRDPRECLAVLHELEDEDVRTGGYTAFDGAAELLRGLQSERWALVTSNYEHRVRGRFARTGLPTPGVGHRHSAQQCAYQSWRSVCQANRATRQRCSAMLEE